MIRIEVVHGDITAQQVDVVVNAANTRLSGGGGVDGAIHRAAGVRQLREACAALGGCDPGDAVATPGFGLEARWIVHTVGPVWAGGDRGEAEVLASCYRRSLELAAALGATSVAFPAISTGVYGYPPELAAQVAWSTLSSLDAGALSPLELVRLVAFDRTTFDRYVALGAIASG